MTLPPDYCTSWPSGLFDFMAGRELGRGDYRTAYLFRPNTNLVLKHEHNPARCNAMEQEFYSAALGTGAEKWLAPVIDISNCGRWLLMARTTPVTHWPERIPVWMNDMNRANYGMFEDRFVCHDYGSAPFFVPALKMKKAVWE